MCPVTSCLTEHGEKSCCSSVADSKLLTVERSKVHVHDQCLSLLRFWCCQLTAAKDRLAALRAEHREAESALRKSKKRAAQDVEAVIAEYDTDVGAKEAEYQVKDGAYTPPYTLHLTP